MHGDDPVVKLPPTLTDDVVREVGEPLRQLARSPGVRLLTLDARDTRDVSARGLGLLVAVSHIAQSRGAAVTLVHVDERLVQLFKVAHLDIRTRALSAVPDCGRA